MLRRACPCGRLNPAKRPVAFADCCAPYLDDAENTPANNAEVLMRSRYSAYVLGQARYLLETWHPRTRPIELLVDDSTKWLGLDVRRHTAVDADHAKVEFVARYRTAGRGARIHELSRFVREAGRWYYLGAEGDAAVDGDLR